MRPLATWKAGDVLPDGTRIKEHYPANEYGQATKALEENFGTYCSYCEQWTVNVELEHVVPKSQAIQQKSPKLASNWNNFLLACRTCNGPGNKGSQEVQMEDYLWPHLHNTQYAYVYGEGGTATVNPSLPDQEKVKAQNMLNLIGLQKTENYSQLSGNDRRRLSSRRQDWEQALLKLADYEAGVLKSPEALAKYARKDCFSIWYSVFAKHTEVRLALIAIHRGTASHCFDEQGNPIPKLGRT